MNLRTSLLSLLLCSATLPALAQRTITFGQDDERDNSKGRRSNTSFSSAGYSRNSVSVNLIGWLSGQTQVYYERGFNDVLSAAVGVGFTTRNYTSGVFSGLDLEESENFRGNNEMDVSDDYGDYKHRKTSVGLALSFSPKVYYTSDCMDGPFIAPRLEYKKFRTEANMVDPTQSMQYISSNLSDASYLPATQQEYLNCLDFTINWGGHYEIGNHVVIGWSSGIGIRNARGQQQDIGVKGNSNYQDYHFVNTVREVEKTSFLASFVITIGGCF